MRPVLTIPSASARLPPAKSSELLGRENASQAANANRTKRIENWRVYPRPTAMRRRAQFKLQNEERRICQKRTTWIWGWSRRARRKYPRFPCIIMPKTRAHISRTYGFLISSARIINTGWGLFIRREKTLLENRAITRRTVGTFVLTISVLFNRSDAQNILTIFIVRVDYDNKFDGVEIHGVRGSLITFLLFSTFRL